MTRSETPLPLHHGSARRGLAQSLWVRLGLALVVVTAVVTLATMWLLPDGAHRGVVAVTEIVAIGAAIAIAALRPDAGPPSRWLLAFPLLVIASVFVTTIASKQVAAAYLGFFTLCFIYVGLTQARWTAVFLIPIVAGVWWYCQTTVPTVSAVRLPISLSIWLLISETLATRSNTLQTEIVQLAGEAQTDALTGLGNRRSLDAALAAIEEGDTVVVIDLDHFKSINDLHGHQAGDRVITEFADAVRTTLRAEDKAFRFGGEEVVVILRQIGDAQPDDPSFGAEAMLRRLRARWSAEGRPTFSAGVSVHHEEMWQETFRDADSALFSAKRAGRDRWYVNESEPAVSLPYS